MLVLHEFAYSWDASSGSPFCAKIDAYCRFAGIPLRRTLADASKAPKGKLPVLMDGGETIADSRWIVEHLRKTYKDLDEGLTASQAATSAALRVMVEEWLYMMVLHWITAIPDNRRIFAQAFLTSVPSPLRGVVGWLAAKGTAHMLNGQGFGRHSEAEKFELAKEVARSLDGQLGDQPFMMGDHPTSLDATVYGFLCVICGNTGFVYPIKVHLLRHEPRLMAYVSRVRAQFFPEETWTLQAVAPAYSLAEAVKAPVLGGGATRRWGKVAVAMAAAALVAYLR